MTDGHVQVETRPGPRDARAAVNRWLREHGRTRFWLAQTLKRSAPTVSRWLGKSRPDEAGRTMLEIVTGTPSEWWRTAKEWREIARLRDAFKAQDKAAA